MIIMYEDDFGALAVCALRYCHGRMTYMPSLIQGIVLEHLSEITDKDLSVILNDKSDLEFTGYGMQVDRENWERFYAMVEEEKRRRKQDEDGRCRRDLQ